MMPIILVLHCSIAACLLCFFLPPVAAVEIGWPQIAMAIKQRQS